MIGRFRPGTSITIILFSSLAAPRVSMPQANDLKPAAVRILSPSHGNGFVFRHEDQADDVYILTCAHVVGSARTVELKFFAQPSKVIAGDVIREDPGRDLAVIKVTGKSDIPANLMVMALGSPSTARPGDIVYVVNYSFANDLWSVLQFNIEGFRDEVIDPPSSRKVHVFRFSGDVKKGDSGSALLLGDQVVGLVHAGSASGEDLGSPIAIDIATIQDFLGDLVPLSSGRPIKGPTTTVQPHVIADVDARKAATSFLDLLILNKQIQAYDMLAAVSKQVFSRDAFIQANQQFVLGANTGLLERKLADTQKPFAPPKWPQLAGETYVLFFECRYKGFPNYMIFETVTVFKEGGTWKIIDFNWNSQTVSP